MKSLVVSSMLLIRKIEIRETGNPTPQLNTALVTKISKETFMKNTRVSMDAKRLNDAIVFPGCSSQQSGESSLVGFGITDLSQKKKKKTTGAHTHTHTHQYSQTHLNSILEFNEQVSKNWFVLSKNIDCINFSGAFELALRGYEESQVYNRLTNAAVFEGTSKEIQNYLLECMLNICQEIIKKEISIARFWQFFNPPGHDAASIAPCSRTVLASFVDEHEKTISQSFDDASVMSAQHNGVRAIIQQQYTHEHYMHCYAYQMSLIVALPTMIEQTLLVTRHKGSLFLAMLLIGEFFTLPLQGGILRVELLTQYTSTENNWLNARTKFSHHVSIQQQLTKLELFGACWMIQYLYFGSQFFTILFFIINADKIRKHVDSFRHSVQKERGNFEKERFSSATFYSAVCLFEVENFQEYYMKFPARLKTELGVIYKREDFRKMSTSANLLQFVVENYLQTTFTETHKMLLITYTIAMTTAEAEI
ncbi:hypothetical protein PR048_019134 [Dryococelus australis]|uniref:Uncharacterized protein n=1 Tax=Dryococelus australis TaxID=614101 RepID=A0ABQ9H305_9NEOP|nr:hypothetical protein PR048_019134 [Dryococelus australis]